MIHLVALVGGIGIIAATAILNVMETPDDWTSPGDLRLLLLAAVVIVTSVVAARLPLSRLMGGVLTLILVACEVVVFVAPIEIATSKAAADEVAVHAHHAAVENARKRIAAAERAFATAGVSPRLSAAIEAKARIDAEVIAKSDTKLCAVNCRELLQAQVASAAAEITAARNDQEATQAGAASELAAARSALEAIGPAPRQSGLAAALGIPALTLAFVLGLAKSLACNGAGAWLVFVGAHGQRPTRDVETVDALPPIQDVPPPPERQQLPPPQPPVLTRVTDEQQHAARFLVEMFDPAGRARLRDVGQAYVWWCGRHSIEPLPMARLAALTGERFKRLNLTVENGEVVGLTLRSEPREVTALSAGAAR